VWRERFSLSGFISTDIYIIKDAGAILATGSHFFEVGDFCVCFLKDLSFQISGIHFVFLNRGMYIY